MGESLEQFIAPKKEHTVSKQEKISSLISRFIEKHIIEANETAEESEEAELQEYYAKLSSREKADVLYKKLMAYMADRQAEAARKKEAEKRGEKAEQKKLDPYFVSEIKILFGDSEVKKLLPVAYGEARVDAKKLRVSELANIWKNAEEEIKSKEKIYKRLEQEVYLNQISGKTAISSAISRMERLADNLTALEGRKKEIETLQGFAKIIENTDVAANFQYENLKEYKKQLDEGFVWLPSRKIIHQKTIGAILNHRWPVLIGEAGSGKSDQADAAAVELSGHLPTHIPCSSKTGEVELIKDVAIDKETGGSYDKYGELLRAFTGYDDSRQERPGIQTGRIVRLDEAYRIPHESSGYSILKEARQVKPGDSFYGKNVLPGAGAIWTTNLPGPRYPGRTAPDAAMRRELAEIKVDYPEMSIKNPELYEFALVALMDENDHIAVAKKELAPAYEKKEIPEDQREILEDNGIIVAKDEIIENTLDQRHGALWRFVSAIKCLQDSFVYGNAETEKYPDTLLRFKEDADGNIEITTDGRGEPLTLSTSTVTLGELNSWMKGFNERRQKRDEEFRVDTLTEWLNFKVTTYLEQADKSDREKIRSLFRHFGFLDKAIIPDISSFKPLTPKEIGYLSPRVPRPVYVEKPPSDEGDTKKQETLPFVAYETRQVLLENGSRALMKVCGLTLENGAFDLEREKLVSFEITIGKKFTVGGESFAFAGVVEDKASPFNGYPIGQLASGENLYKVFTPKELNLGVEKWFKDLIGETGTDDMKEDLLNYWEIEGCKAKHGEFVF